MFYDWQNLPDIKLPKGLSESSRSFMNVLTALNTILDAIAISFHINIFVLASERPSVVLDLILHVYVLSKYNGNLKVFETVLSFIII